LSILTPVCNAMSEIIGASFRFAVEAPLISIPFVLGMNILMLYTLSEGGPVAIALGLFATALTTPARALSSWIWNSVLELSSQHHLHGIQQERPLLISDATFALFTLVAIQVCAWELARRRFDLLTAFRSSTTGAALAPEEQETLATAMADPRQCGACGLGPVDHHGCNDLQAHHGEVTMAREGWRVSNACPRCGWFARRLDDWPIWELPTAAATAVREVRTWSEASGIIRASSKAFVIPFALLRLGTWMPFDRDNAVAPALSAFLALSYTIPWVWHNWSAAQEMIQPPPYHHRTPRRRISDRNSQADSTPSNNSGADCGASSRHEDESTAEPSSVLLATVLSAAPTRVFLKEGDCCSVCLEDFESSAVTAAATKASPEALREALRTSRPPIVGLRCGHALHIECAEAAVAASNGRHVRCPLCREPVTLFGAAAARAFN
jgi:hypothetical protein